MVCKSELIKIWILVVATVILQFQGFRCNTAVNLNVDIYKGIESSRIKTTQHPKIISAQPNLNITLSTAFKSRIFHHIDSTNGDSSTFEANKKKQCV